MRNIGHLVGPPVLLFSLWLGRTGTWLEVEVGKYSAKILTRNLTLKLFPRMIL